MFVSYATMIPPCDFLPRKHREYFVCCLGSASVLPCIFMSKEGSPLQFDLFSGELVDARSDSQKKKDRERTIPQQMQMFKTPEMVQFGSKTRLAYRDWLDQASAPPLVLQMIETRTPEEIECDLMREAEKLMTPMFTEEPPAEVEEPPTMPKYTSLVPHSGVIFSADQHHCQRGLRARLRTQSILVRHRSMTR